MSSVPQRQPHKLKFLLKISQYIMEKFLTAVLILHIVSGLTALVVGLIAMFTPKGSPKHSLWGRIYYYAMMLVAITAVLRFKNETRLVFLTCIAVFSFYNTFTGRRLVLVGRKNNWQAQDWVAAFITVISGIVMIAYGVWAYQQGVTFYFVLFGLFGLFSLIIAISDILTFIGKINQPWMLNHISRMGGSYIATVTAFLVVNNHNVLPSLVAWIGPGVIGGVIIGRVRRKYKQKMQKA